MRLVVLAIIALAASGCAPSEPSEKWTNDQVLRAKIFKECLAEVPAGPVSTQYNDWNEVVESCESAAYWQSRYCYENCPPARKEAS